MSQILLNRPSSRRGYSLWLWALLETELLKGNAFLLPLRLFMGLGWLRAGVEKLIDPAWTSGAKLPIFFQTQTAADAVYFPFYETLVTQLFEPHAFMLSWIVLIGELLAGAAILTGTLTNLALLGGLFMSLNFVLAGVVNPSAFYIVIQSSLLMANAGSTLGGDSFLSRYIRSFVIAAQSQLDFERNTFRKWGLLLIGILCCLTAALVVPYIRDFGLHSIDDPAMLLFILLMLGAMFIGIVFVRGSRAEPGAHAQAHHAHGGDGSTPVAATAQSKRDLRKFVYPGLLLVLYVTWFSYMAWSDSGHLFTTLWPVSLTMTLGSFVAGATAEGGAAIAFPVFTKVLHIAAPDARTFGLMIQAVGMTMAGIVLLLQRVKVLPRVILWATIGGAIGQVIGTYWLHLPNPYPKILFTFTAAVFGFALIISRWGLKWEPRATLHRWTRSERALFCTIGLCGGAFASITGSGIDMLTFIVLTLAFGINEKISTPTTVIIMALNSIVGFALHGLVLQDIGVAWDYWLVAIPIVVVGAPLGALVASRTKRDHIILFLISLITLELVTTVLLVPFSPTAMRVTAIAVLVCSAGFGGMLLYRQRMVKTHDTEIHKDGTELHRGKQESSRPITSEQIGTSTDRTKTTSIVLVQGRDAAYSPTADNETDSSVLHEVNIAQVCCANCQKTQGAENGDCAWCGTSLAFAHLVPKFTQLLEKRDHESSIA